MRAMILQHTVTNPAGIYAEVLREHGATTTVVEVDDGEPIPRFDDFDAIVAMGGAMGVNDTEEFPWLLEEMRVIRDAARAGVPVWGACLGGQLLAASLGARVFRMREPEIGFVPVELTQAAADDAVFARLPRPFCAFQWHSDAFELPEGAVRLGGSGACANQAFRWGANAYGVQFHLEATADMVARWLEGSRNRAAVDRALGAGGADRVLEELDRRGGEQTENARILTERWIDQMTVGAT